MTAEAVGPALALVASEPTWIREPELRATTYPDAAFLIAGELPVGYTLLMGAPKTGKTALMLPIAQDLARAGHRVAYLALDDSPRRMQSRDLMASPSEEYPDLWFCFWTPESAAVGFAQLDEWLQEARNQGQAFDFVVVDTYGVFVGARPKGDVFGFDYRMGQMFKALCAKHGTSIMAAHHTRKGDVGDDWLDQMSGSAGMAASSDAIWLVTRTRGSREGVVRMTSNDMEEVAKPITLGDDMVWRPSTTTTVAQARHTGAPRAILDHLMSNPRSTLGELADATGERENTLRSALQRLQHEGLVELERTDWSLTDTPDNSLPVPGRVMDRATGTIAVPARGTCRLCGLVMTDTGTDTHPTCLEPPTTAAAEEGSDLERASGLRMMKDAISASRMKPLPVVPKDKRDEAPWTLMHELMAGEHRWELAPLVEWSHMRVAVLDRNGSYPSAAGSVPVAANALTHTGPLDERGGRAGIFLVDAFEWPYTGIGHPLGRISEQPGPWWITTPHMKFLEDYAGTGAVPAPVILDSYTGLATSGLFTAFSKRVQVARNDAKAAGDAEEYVRVKRSSSIAIRCLWPKEAASPFWRPDWLLSIKAEASVRHWIRASQAVRAGATLLRLGSVDEAVFLAPSDATAEWAPEPYKLGTTYGCVKHKDDVLIEGTPTASPLTLEQWSKRGRRARG